MKVSHATWFYYSDLSLPLFQVEYSENTFVGQLTNPNELWNWAVDKCIPLVREITFQNAEVVFFLL